MKRLVRSAACGLLSLSISGMAAGAVSGASVERVDATHVILTWSASGPVEVYLSERADDDRKRAKLLSTGNHDGRYLATVPGERRPYFLLRDKDDGGIARVAERLLPLERASNFRDVGGYPAAEGKHVRWGLIYRAAATPLLSENDIAAVRALGLSAMIDLRSSEERVLAPAKMLGQGIRYIAADYAFDRMPRNYAGLLTSLAPQYRAIFRELLARPGPISYNCTAGQDRTGIATALILSALGVSRETILQDYHVSTGFRRPQYEVLPIDPAAYPGNSAAPLLARVLHSTPQPLFTSQGRSLLAELFDQIDTNWGSVDKYLEQVLEIEPTQIAALRATYLE
jgi:protein-tyrosine phosphatase